MGDICSICEGPHSTQNHGHDLDETPPPQGYPAIRWCWICENYHPFGGVYCDMRDDDDER